MNIETTLYGWPYEKGNNKIFKDKLKENEIKNEIEIKFVYTGRLNKYFKSHKYFNLYKPDDFEKEDKQNNLLLICSMFQELVDK